MPGWEWARSHALLSVVILVTSAVAAFVAVGFAIFDEGDFAGNILAEATGLGIGVVVTFVVVEWVLHRERASQWAGVTENLVLTTARVLTYVASLYSHETRPWLPAAEPLQIENWMDPAFAGPPIEAFASDIDAIARRLDDVDDFSHWESSASLQNEVDEQIEWLSDSVFARVFMIGQDAQFARHILQIEATRTNWHSDAAIEEHGLPGEVANPGETAALRALGWRSATRHLEAIADMYRYLVELHRRELPRRRQTAG